MSDASTFNVQTVVVGAGIVGIAIARELAVRGHDVLVLEQERRAGEHQTSRNSGVIHAGIYYAPDSMKARLCAKANRALYEYAESHGIPHRRIGKLVVAATEEQTTKLAKMAARAKDDGVGDVELLDAASMAKMEPEVAGVGGLWSPSTGIIDTHAYLLALRGEAEAHGAAFAMGCKVIRGEVENDGWRITAAATDSSEEYLVRCKLLINSAGIHAVELARNLDACPRQRIPDSYLARGNFFSYHGHMPFSRLIYPLPDSIGLGIHLTFDLGGQAKFGPDVDLIDEFDYRVPDGREQAFYTAIRRFWPGIKEGTLTPAYAGIRAKIGKPGMPQDWIIDTPSEHKVSGLVNLFGIETPGVTCAMAIATEVADRIREESFA
jgi:L-2-hydroxyglutarate oxidase LhgO